MPPIVWLVFVGGAFLLGRVSAKQEQKPKGPIPPVPALPPPPEASTGADYTEEWDAADYPIDVFPAEAASNAERLLPPPMPDGITVAPGCRAIAVGQEWWPSALEAARVSRFELGLSVSRTVDSIARSAAAACQATNAPAVRAFRTELMSRVRGLELPERNQPYETIVTE